MLQGADYRNITPSSLDELAARWDPSAKVTRLLGDAENLVWRAEGKEPFVLRMTHASHRSHAALEAELAWLEALNHASLPVCRPIPSLEGKLLEPYEVLGEHFETVAFAWLEGAEAEGKDFWQPALIQMMGKLAARLHLQALKLSPAQLAARPGWRSGFIADPGSYLPASERWILEPLTRCQDQLEALPQDLEHYGLIHGDIHGGNFLVLDQQIQLFDFDDCHLGWHAQDLALILYGAVPREGPTETYSNWFMDQLKIGYRTIRAWPELYSENQELFLHWRDLQIFCFIHRRWPEGSPRPDSANRSLARLTARIKAGKTILDAEA